MTSTASNGSSSWCLCLVGKRHSEMRASFDASPRGFPLSARESPPGLPNGSSSISGECDWRCLRHSPARRSNPSSASWHLESDGRSRRLCASGSALRWPLQSRFFHSPEPVLTSHLSGCQARRAGQLRQAAFDNLSSCRGKKATCRHSWRWRRGWWTQSPSHRH